MSCPKCSRGGFVKNTSEKYLLEHNSGGPQVNISDQTQSLVNSIKDLSDSGIITVYGNYGSGKSRLIESVLKNPYFSDYKKFHFDAWQYPDKKDLWEGFIVETVEQINKEKSKRVQADLDGEDGPLKKFVKNLAPVADITSVAVSGIPAGTLTTRLFFDAFFQKSPAKRIKDYGELLGSYLNNYVDEEGLVLVIEDIDRSGTYGVTFLETLSNFISSGLVNKTIFVLVPIDIGTYQNELQKYEKFTVKFFQFKLNPETLQQYLEEIICDCKKVNLENLTPLLVHLINREGLTMRKLKLALRQANDLYLTLTQNGHSPSWEILLSFVVLKFIPLPKNQPGNYAIEKVYAGSSETFYSHSFNFLKTFVDWPEESFIKKIEYIGNDHYVQIKQSRLAQLNSQGKPNTDLKDFDLPVPRPMNPNGNNFELVLPDYYQKLVRDA